jgi:hypothetical protein
LRGFLFERGFEMGKVDQTLFSLKQGRDILIVQVYVDDIVFGGSSNSLVARFADDMSREFELSMMGEFLGSSWVSWSSRKQSSVAQSTTEAEYVATASCWYQLLWITYTMSDFGEEYTHVPLQCDSTSAISVAKNPVLHSKIKHIEVRYHFLRDKLRKGR